jgi:lipopolysaccharide transport system ATP-binding protein
MTEAIKVENLGKCYQLRRPGAPTYETFRDLLHASGQRVHAWLRGNRSDRHDEHFWALKGVSFAINEGERVGIVGRNGAGKSTLLKILSRVTEPSEGRVELRGRVASLLEVGTGFNPELTGRENVLLSGAIMGMHRSEIEQKFAEIMAFGEVQRFIDTPVKRYSSGMYMRLAFSVAAHLDCDILLVDEVLAVGDHQFQQKCLGKMRELGQSKRTVIFVSHNMGVIRSLCDKAIYLQSGAVAHIGNTEDVVQLYMEQNRDAGSAGEFHREPPLAAFTARIQRMAVAAAGTSTHRDIRYREPFSIQIDVLAEVALEDVVVGAAIIGLSGETLTTMHSVEIGTKPLPGLSTVDKGKTRYTLTVRDNVLRPGVYFVGSSLFNRRLHSNIDVCPPQLRFVISEYGDDTYFDGRQTGLFFFREAVWEKSVS